MHTRANTEDPLAGRSHHPRRLLLSNRFRADRNGRHPCASRLHGTERKPIGAPRRRPSLSGRHRTVQRPGAPAGLLDRIQPTACFNQRCSRVVRSRGAGDAARKTTEQHAGVGTRRRRRWLRATTAAVLVLSKHCSLHLGLFGSRSNFINGCLLVSKSVKRVQRKLCR
jgi:hypothetical protein